MATKYVCDRCRKESNERRQIPTVTITKAPRSSYDERDEVTQTFDLCSNCQDQLEAFLKPLAVKRD